MIRPTRRTAAASPAPVLLATVLLLTAGVGCSNGPVHVRTVRTDTIFHKMRRNVLNAGAVSESTQQLLRRYDLAALYDDKPLDALAVLDRMVREQPDPDAVFALAELCYLSAGALEVKARASAISLYFGTVA
ncbi:MAG: hypothetical protein ACRC1K_22865, partial [Planctomycetia bacterium]